MGDRKTVCVLIGDIHTDHPKKIISGLYDSYRGSRDTNVHFYLGAENAVFFKESAQLGGDFDYQYLCLYDYAFFEKYDEVLVAIGAISTFHKVDKKKFLHRFDDVPCIVLEDTIEPANGAYIISDNYKGMYENVKHLIEFHRYRNIVFLAGPRENQDSKERLAAFRDCMAHHGLTVTDDMIAYGDYSEYVDSAVRQLFRRNEDIQAIVSANDEMTVAIYRECERRGLKVGTDIAVTGFDDMEMARIVQPPLTTVKQQSYLMGTQAFDMARAALDGEKISPARVPVEIICRHSCGCKKELKEKGTEETLYSATDFSRQIYHQALNGPFMIRELIRVAEDDNLFYYKIGQAMSEFGAKNSYLYTLPEIFVYDKDHPWKQPEELVLSVRQRGRDIYSYDAPVAPRIHLGEGLCNMDSDKGGHIFFNFLLFDGAKQYGILSVEIEPKLLTFFYMLSLQIGTALHFLEMTHIQKGYFIKLQEQNAALNYTAMNDALTGIYNRRGIMEKVEEMGVLDKGKRAFLLIADLDHLKQINDIFGHGEGDFAIREAAAILKRALGRESTIGRIGGDEFLAVLPQAGNGKAHGDELKTRIKEECAAFNETSGKPYFVEISVGITSFVCRENLNIAKLTRAADDRLYEDKSVRRQSVVREEAMKRPTDGLLTGF